MRPSLKGLKDIDIKVTTPEGRAAKRAAQKYLAGIRSKKDAFEALKRIGIFKEDGTPNPYFFPELEAKKTGRTFD